jgi:Mg/Co/Ni transporter MgtE
MNRRRLVLVLVSLACLGAAAGVLTWHFWPEPPPSTADQVYDAVMGAEPQELSDEEVADWIETVADTVDRLPPHEFEQLVTRALGDEKLRERFEALKPEQRRRLMNLVSEEQRSRMMAKMGPAMVKHFKAMPAPVRKVVFEQMMKRHRERRGKGTHPEMTPRRFVERHAATTPRQRAEFVRAMREMRKMLQEAGVKP